MSLSSIDFLIDHRSRPIELSYKNVHYALPSTVIQSREDELRDNTVALRVPVYFPIYRAIAILCHVMIWISYLFGSYLTVHAPQLDTGMTSNTIYLAKSNQPKSVKASWRTSLGSRSTSDR